MCQKILFVLLACFGLFSNAEIVLKKNVNQIVNFADDELVMRIDSKDEGLKQVTICFTSKPNSTSSLCPKGFASLSFINPTNERSTKVVLGRDGEVKNKSNYDLKNRVIFNKDGSIGVLVTIIPDDVTITLVNAEKVVSAKSSDSRNGVIYIVVGIGILIVVILTVGGIIIWRCFCRSSSTHVAVPTMPPVDDHHRIDNKNQCPQQRSATKRTSSSTTKPSDEKRSSGNVVTTEAVVIASVPQVTPETVMTPLLKNEPVLSTPQSNLSLTLKTARSKTRKSKKSKKHKKRRVSVTTEPTTLTLTNETITKPLSPNLPVDRTQSATEPTRTSDPTPDFGTDATANSLSKNSEYKARGYLRRNETPVFGRTSKRHRMRVIDEIEGNRRETETYVCFSERVNKLNGHNHMRLVERVHVDVQHEISDAERLLLKAAPADAPRLADVVVQQAHNRMNIYCFDRDYRKVSWDEGPDFWAMINNPATPASDGFLVMYHLIPEIYKLQKESLSDELLRKMPLCGVYTLLLDDRFSTEFRIELAGELRRRSSNILPSIQKDALRHTCFPANYLALAFAKNKKAFIDGKEIHSKHE